MSASPRLPVLASLLALAACAAPSGPQSDSNPDNPSAFSNPQSAIPGFPFRIWQLQDADPAHIRELIEEAPKHGVTGIQLSHNIVMDAEDLLNEPGRVRRLRPLCRLARERGLEVSVWTHELNGVPATLKKDGRVDLTGPAAWDWLTAKYNRLFDLVPELDDIVLTFHETEVSVYHDAKVISDEPPAARVARLINTIGAVCVARKKSLTVRTFCYEPKEVAFIQEGLAGVTTPIRVMTKCQPHDWQPYYPYSPEVGKVGGHPQVIEFDLGYEFLGQSRYPYCDLPYLIDRMEHARARGAVGAVLRVERFNFRSYGTPNWTTVAAFTQYLRGPVEGRGRGPLPPEAVGATSGRDLAPSGPEVPPTAVLAGALLRGELARRYGADAAADLTEAHLKTFDCVNKTLFALGSWITNHSRLPAYDYATKSLKGRATAKWDPDPKWARIERDLLSPAAETVGEILAEKDEAAKLAAEAVAAFERARPKLTPDDAAFLGEYFHRLPAVVEIWRAQQEAYFQCRVWEERKDPAAAKAARAAAARLRELAAQHEDVLRAINAEKGKVGEEGQVALAKQIAGEIEQRTKAGE